MKLLAKYNSVNIMASILVLLIGGLCYYFIISFVLINQLDKDLLVEEQEIKDYLSVHDSLPKASLYKDQKIEFKSAGVSGVERSIKSIILFDEAEAENVASRQLTFFVSSAGKHYKVSITRSKEEAEDLVELIVEITLALVLLLLLGLFIINRFVLNKLWIPFNNTLKELKNFNLNTAAGLQLQETRINEFQELNSVVKLMSNQVIKDYDALKSFTENASHEIQTPLAIVQLKLELLMQSENFSASQMQHIQTIQEEISRLSKLNKSLLLLTKIDNRQFNDVEEVDVEKNITKLLANYEELMAAKHIKLTKYTEAKCKVFMNEMMAEVMFSNLITNAIKHNIYGGTIEVVLSNIELIIRNTGRELNCNPEELFERFKKDKVASDSLGLGLAIVKKICLQYNFGINYSCTDAVHSITVRFL